jgi:DNA-binding response OmpR family regulator
MANILLVDDDPALRALVHAHLVSAGHGVTSATDGSEALQLATAIGPDLIVSDIMMPGVNGFELLKTLRARPDTVMIPVILITAAHERAVYREGMRLGADDYLEKPVRRDDLLDAVATRLRRVQELREAFLRNATSQRTAARLPEPPAARQPINVEGYRVVRKLGQGGMSRVYLAEHLATGTERVLKIVPISDGDEGETVQRFIHEFALVSSIEHPNVARIYDQGFTDDYAYIAMEYFPGGDLRGMIGDGMAPELGLAVLMQVSSGLSAIHHQGIVHRDMKPDNVMVRSEGTLAIADFGIAKKPMAQLSDTQHGEVFGTPYYLSPEQATSGTVDARSDLYSLGVMFYEILTGAKPYRAADIEGLLYQHLNAPVPTFPASLGYLQPLLDRTMAKDPEMRFASADELVAACAALEET